MSKVLLTDGIHRKTVSVVRSLGKKGIRTFVGDKQSFSPAGSSRYCYQTFVYPDPEKGQEKFYQCLQEQIDKSGCEVLFPMDDLTLSIIMNNRKQLENKCLIPLPENKSYSIASDKYETFLLASRSNVDCPNAYMPKSVEDLINLSEQIDYPVVIKPRKSSGSRGIRVVKDADELLFQYRTIHLLYPFPMIQEYIPQGNRYDVCLLYDQNHQIKCAFIQKEIRHFPIEMGPSTVQESIEYPELLEYSQRLLTELNWTGIVEVEFMIDPRSGSPKLMEINPRFWNSLELSIKCGVDFPYFLLKVALNEPFENVMDYSLGVKTRWLIPGDILHFLTNKNRFQMDPPFINVKNNLYDDTFLVSDPLPSIATIAACIRYGLKPTAWKMMFKR
jgi:predicted ATP-grasp superfamily ATP-dependent carboligase